jgi:hypothetical protein
MNGRRNGPLIHSQFLTIVYNIIINRMIHSQQQVNLQKHIQEEPQTVILKTQASTTKSNLGNNI